MVCGVPTDHVGNESSKGEFGKSADTPRQARTISRRGLSLLMILVIMLLTVAGVYLIQAVEEPHHPPAKPVPVVVEVARVIPEAFTHQLQALGTVQAIREASVSVKVTGPVVHIPPSIELGAAVEPGTLLAELDPTTFRIDVRQRQALLTRAQAQIRARQVEIRRQETLISINQDKRRLARAAHDRHAALLTRGIIAEQHVEHMELTVRRIQEELERAESGLLEARTQRAVVVADAKVAEAELARARQALADTQVRAPFAGIISAKRITLGEHVAPGTVLFGLADLARVKIIIRVPADEIRFLQPGTLAQVMVRQFSEPFQGRVAHLGPRADSETRTFPAEILVDNHGPQRLLPGMFARVRVPVRVYPAAILVSRTNIVREGEAPAVFVVDPERETVHRRPVTIARTFGSRQLITQGLLPGDLLVVNGQRQLEDGATVRVVKTQEVRP